MILGQCEYCGEAFSGAGSKICAKCAREIDKVFTQVRRYLYSAEGGVNAAKIAEELDVPEKAVLYLIDSGRIVTQGNMEWTDKCHICGKPIPRGASMCVDCSKSIKDGLNKYQSEKIAMLQKELKDNKKRIQPMRTAGRD